MTGRRKVYIFHRDLKATKWFPITRVLLSASPVFFQHSHSPDRAPPHSHLFSDLSTFSWLLLSIGIDSISFIHLFQSLRKYLCTWYWAFPGSSVVKNPPVNAGALGSIPGSEDSLGSEDPLEEEMATHSSIPAWKIPWTGAWQAYSPWGCKRVRHDLVSKQVLSKFWSSWYPKVIFHLPGA